MNDPDVLDISILTTIGLNVGDEFIRQGILSVIDRLDIRYRYSLINKHDRNSLSAQKKAEQIAYTDKFWESDIIIQGGAPVYWSLLEGQATSLTSEWYDWFWEDRVFSDKQGPDFINLGAGSCQPWGDTGETYFSNPSLAEYTRKATLRSVLTVVRDPVAANILKNIEVDYYSLPCPAFLAGTRYSKRPFQSNTIGINLMPLGSHFDLGDINESDWFRIAFETIQSLRRKGNLFFIAHDKIEYKYMSLFLSDNEVIFFSDNWQDYIDAYSRCGLVLANRVHGAVCAAGFGVPSIIVGNDTRARIGEYIGIPVFRSGHSSSNMLISKVEECLSNQMVIRSDLFERQEKALQEYTKLMKPLVGQAMVKKTKSAKGRKRAKCKLADLTSITSERYHEFINEINSFADKNGLRRSLNWSTDWEYPFLWFQGLSAIRWPGKRILDIGPELSPMPWIIARLSADVSLIEKNDSVFPIWSVVKENLQLSNIDWKLVDSELLPYEDNTIDVVTSFSVIEHLPDQKKAIDEVARVLKPGGTFAISFDICEPSMGMTFPEWNGKALTIKEFEDIIWMHSSFGNTEQPIWNLHDIPDFIRWHMQTASHHNYTVGAALLTKKGIVK